MARPEAILEENAPKILWGFIAVHVLCWTLLPVFLQVNAPLDVVEGFAWGHGWQWSYHHHPPLQAWLLESMGWLVGVSPFGYSFLSAICSGLGLWAIFQTGLLIGRPLQALIAALLAEGILYFNYLTPEFNPNILSLAVWALAGCAFAHAILIGKTRHWLILGALLALGFYAKYVAALLLAVFFLFMLADKNARKQLFTYKPWLGFALFLVLMAPQFIWLVHNHFTLLNFAVSRTKPAVDALQHLWLPAKFLLAQIADMLPMLLLSLPFFLNTKSAPKDALREGTEARLLSWLAFAPLILAFLISLGMGAGFKDMWGTPMLCFIPLWIVIWGGAQFSIRRLAVFVGAWNVVFVLCMVAFAISQLYSQEFGYKPLRSNFPGAELSKEIHAQWKKKTGKPLAITAGDVWLAGNVALYAPSFRDRPQVVLEGDFAISPWVTWDEAKKKGMVLVWDADKKKPNELLKKFPFAALQKPIILKYKTALGALEDTPPAHIGWAIFHPRK